MHKISVRMLSLSLLLLFIQGCGNGVLDEFETAKDKICACEDRACVKTVMKDNKALKDKIKDMMNEDKLKAMKFVELAQACAKKIR